MKIKPNKRLVRSLLEFKERTKSRGYLYCNDWLSPEAQRAYESILKQAHREYEASK